jgi:hypothetical protein
MTLSRDQELSEKCPSQECATGSKDSEVSANTNKSNEDEEDGIVFNFL